MSSHGLSAISKTNVELILPMSDQPCRGYINRVRTTVFEQFYTKSIYVLSTLNFKHSSL